MTQELWVSETFINQTRGYNFGESEPYETYCTSIGKLFKAMQREYGRCVSKVYIDTDAGTKAVGWVFEKRMVYDDCRRMPQPDDHYIREVWVTVHHGPPARTVECDYAEIEAA